MSLYNIYQNNGNKIKRHRVFEISVNFKFVSMLLSLRLISSSSTMSWAFYTNFILPTIILYPFITSYDWLITQLAVSFVWQVWFNWPLFIKLLSIHEWNHDRFRAGNRRHPLAPAVLGLLVLVVFLTFRHFPRQLVVKQPMTGHLVKNGQLQQNS